MPLFWTLNNLSDSKLADTKTLELARLVVRAETGASLLVSGLEGFGQSVIANEICSAFLCMNPVSGKACGECKTCGAFGRGNSADFLHIVPEGTSRKIKVGQISPREPSEQFSIYEFLRVKPLASPFKVVLISDSERMTPEAANSLLKMLEEPPVWARFVLTTSAISQLPTTIRSRCLLVSCSVTDIDASEAALALANSAPETVWKLMSEDFVEFTEPFYRWLCGISIRSSHEALKISEEFQQFCEIYRESAKLNKDETRAANVSTFGLLANGISHLIRNGNRELTPVLNQVLSAHRATQDNTRFQYVCDSLFVSWKN